MAGLSEDLVAALVAARCPRPCKGPPTLTQKRLMPDGSLEVSGDLPRPLCTGCPERHNPKLLRHLEVRFETEPGGGIGDLVDTESTPGEGIAIINVLYDAPRSAILAVEGR
jgi:hypothetical protein